jgi:Raf kinase inhibitor-like YbhB/YbcL family protein
MPGAVPALRSGTGRSGQVRVVSTVGGRIQQEGRAGLGRYGRAVNWRAVNWRARAVPGKARTAAATAGALALGLLSGCGLAGGPGALGGDAPEIMTVTSPMLDQGAIERQYTCDGPGETPPISWSGMPARTKSVAIVMDDSAAPITPRMYWIVFDISPSTSDLEPGNLPDGARVARNSAGQVGYDPPCPPPGGTHRYRFTVYALGSVLRQPTGTSLKSAWTAIAQNAIARGRFPATASAVPRSG